jgi:hypothetical protein
MEAQGTVDLYNIDYKGGQDMEQPQQVLDAIMPG